MKPQPGITVQEWMNNARYAVNGQLVTFEGVKYFAGDVRADGLVELRIDVKHDQPDNIGPLDLVEFIED